MKEDILVFVARYFRPDALDGRKAWRRVGNGRRATRQWPVFAFAFALAAAVVGIILFLPHNGNWTQIAPQETAHTVILPDGTRSVLAPGATLAFDEKRFAHKDRDVRMRGKVYFEVERNERLPFRIEASDAVVTVLGTRFQVLQTTDSTTVDVVSGRVSLAASSCPSESVTLEGGMHAALASGTSVPVRSASTTLNPASWATHSFTYEDTPLEKVLEDLSRCFGVHISCDAAGRFLSGNFKADSPEEAASLLEETLDVTITLL